MMDLGYRVLRSPARPEPVRARLEIRLEDGFQDQLERCLDYPVGQGGDGDFILPILAVVSGNLAFSMMFLLVRSCQRGLTSEASQRGSGASSAAWRGGHGS